MTEMSKKKRLLRYNFKKKSIFAPLFRASLGLWCNGNTADSGPAFPGSNPGSPAEGRRAEDFCPSFLFSSARFCYLRKGKDYITRVPRWEFYPKEFVTHWT